MLDDMQKLSKIFREHNPDILIHLAAQAGVRYSFENPKSYLEMNIQATFNLLEILKEHHIEHALIASTSSVYGSSKKLPFKENDKCSSGFLLQDAKQSRAHGY